MEEVAVVAGAEFQDEKKEPGERARVRIQPRKEK